MRVDCIFHGCAIVHSWLQSCYQDEYVPHKRICCDLKARLAHSYARSELITFAKQQNPCQKSGPKCA